MNFQNYIYTPIQQYHYFQISVFQLYQLTQIHIFYYFVQICKIAYTATVILTSNYRIPAVLVHPNSNFLQSPILHPNSDLNIKFQDSISIGPPKSKFGTI